MDLITETTHKKRLIVLIPEGMAGGSELAKRIYGLALREQCDVIYLGFVYDEAKKLSVARNMATLKALTASDEVLAGSRLTSSDAWSETLRTMLRPGDTLVCHDEQHIRQGLFTSLPVRQVLAAEFKAPIYSISGFYHPWVALTKKWLWGLLFWVGCLAILAAFSILEIQVDHAMQGLSKAVFIAIMLAAEFTAFLTWNKLPKI